MRVRDRLRTALSLASDAATVREIAQTAAGLGAESRTRLAEECARALLAEGSYDEKLRVVLAKTLIALLPESFRRLAKLLSPDVKGAGAEAQFSLFAFLGEVPQLFAAHETRERVLELVRQYLLNVNHDVAQASWMAGDLLGDHWPFEESVPVLAHAAKHARFVAGREGALHGISHALDHVPKRVQWELVATLKGVTENDRSARVRRYAQSILGNLRGI
jgi:hypothetical protein